MPKTLPAPKKAAQLGVGKVFLYRILPSKGLDLPSSRNISDLESTLKGALRRAADLRAQIHASHFGVEKSEIQTLKTELEWRLEYADHAIRALRPRIHNYPILSAEPLTWRDEEGFPKLVILPIDGDGNVQISASQSGWQYEPIGTGSGHGDFDEIGQEIVLPCYQSVGELLKKKASYDKRVSIKTNLGGLLIPKRTRSKIEAARAHFGNQIFLIAEAPKWEINEVVLPKPDPLIVGFEDGLLFLIDQFNLTRLERVVAAEYTLG